eukprot:tig00021275_g19865.t2
MQGHFSSAPGTPVDRARALYLPCVQLACAAASLLPFPICPGLIRSASACSSSAGGHAWLRTRRGPILPAPAGPPVDNARASYLPCVQLVCAGSFGGRWRSGPARAVDSSRLRLQRCRSATLGLRTRRGPILPAPAGPPVDHTRASYLPCVQLACAGSFGGRWRSGPVRAVDSSRLRLQRCQAAAFGPRTRRGSISPAPVSVAAGAGAPDVPWTPLACACVRFPALDPSRLHRVRRPAPPLSCRAVPRPYDLRRFRWLPALGPRTCRGLLSPAPGPPPGLFSSAQAAGPVGHAWASHPPWILLACTGRAAGRIARSPYLPWVQFACAGSFGGRRRSSPARAVDFSRLRLQRCRAVAHWRDIFHPSYLSLQRLHPSPMLPAPAPKP